MGLIDMQLTNPSLANNNIFDVIVNNQIKVRYDLLDGFNWGLGESDSGKFELFSKLTGDCDYYFKRSFHPILENYAKASCKVLPLGFNLNVVPSSYYFLKKGLSSLIFTPKVLLNWLSNFAQDNIEEKYYSYPPVQGINVNILFYTRLWDPADYVDSSDFSDHLAQINITRIQSLQTCRKNFGDQFKGGLYDSPIARRLAPELILNRRAVRKLNYLKEMKKSSICISTAGLHNSTGWKMAEYIAASRAIVSEPLHYLPTGNFQKNMNYLEFHSTETLIGQIEQLLVNPDLRAQMMKANQEYYQNFLRPDQLVLNSLKKIQEYA
ncbi:hypothetical protein KIH41_05040 [Litoribacter ruber]|uniref:Glycosyltransferase family 1 protein n=1 Tax=Litoribacter ruber TaxID=702568 RepID=A0AAP2CET0_9BACT|nr:MULTISPECIES: glycosyltransferase [Litoribacter]MBS9523198.1 hypothetical protein [Litoribacter alkaliphilus]MBT0810639.1 hypothetical protein [Litoribacter ruber]